MTIQLNDCYKFCKLIRLNSILNKLLNTLFQIHIKFSINYLFCFQCSHMRNSKIIIATTIIHWMNINTMCLHICFILHPTNIANVNVSFCIPHHCETARMFTINSKFLVVSKIHILFNNLFGRVKFTFYSTFCSVNN